MLTLEAIRQAAFAVGLDDVGVAPATRLEDDAAFMDRWIEDCQLKTESDQDKLWYLTLNREKRYDPRILVPGTQTVLVGVLTFAHSGRDYHRTMKSKLYALEAQLKEIAGPDIVSSDYQHIFCDSAPFLERRWAQQAGLGFIGKNHTFIHPTLGSLIHLGELCLNITLPLYPSTPLPQKCEACMRCVEACPRGVLGKDTWDVRQCIAYETNECLICQNSCPYNEKSQ